MVGLMCKSELQWWNLVSDTLICWIRVNIIWNNIIWKLLWHILGHEINTQTSLLPRKENIITYWATYNNLEIQYSYVYFEPPFIIKFIIKSAEFHTPFERSSLEVSTRSVLYSVHRRINVYFYSSVYHRVCIILL